MIIHELLQQTPIETERRSREKVVVPEVEPRESIGVVLIVVAPSESNEGPLVWTILEQENKEETDKFAGQISLPAETRKVGEQEVDTVLGALAEFTDSDETLRYLRFNPDAFYAKEPIRVKGKPVDVAFLVYDGPTLPMQSVDPSETIANGWMSTRAIQRYNGEVRNLAHDSIGFAFANDVFRSLVADKEGLVPLASILEPDFSIKPFIERRETLPDVPLK